MVAELPAPSVRTGASPAVLLLSDLLQQGVLAPAKATAPLARRDPVAKIEELLRELDESRAER